VKGLLAALATTLLVLAGCGCGATSTKPSSTPTAASSPSGPARTLPAPIRVGSAPATITLASQAFGAGSTIPGLYTCSGRDISPPLRWSGVPDGTRELALELIDPDAPGGPFLHWALAGIRPTVRSLAAGESIPPGAVAGTNSFGKIGYGGPCPPTGAKPHRYVFVLLALRSASGLNRGFGAGALPVSQALALGELQATFGRP
jgi:Raf kinase inhibitor-like YbhB/YbcL family protein